MSIEIEGKFNTSIEILRNYETGRIEHFLNILYLLGYKDSYIGTLIETILWIPEWNMRKDTNSIEYYMKKGIQKFFDEIGVNYRNCNNSDSFLYTNSTKGDTYHEKMKYAKIYNSPIEEILTFISYYISNVYTDKKDKCYGVKITVVDDSINFERKLFNNEEELIFSKDYHNDAKYYVEKLREYGINCLYKSVHN